MQNKIAEIDSFIRNIQTRIVCLEKTNKEDKRKIAELFKASSSLYEQLLKVKNIKNGQKNSERS